MGLEYPLVALGSAMSVGKMDGHKEEAVHVLGESVYK